jgi:hypothetical protein
MANDPNKITSLRDAIRARDAKAIESRAKAGDRLTTSYESDESTLAILEEPQYFNTLRIVVSAGAADLVLTNDDLPYIIDEMDYCPERDALKKWDIRSAFYDDARAGNIEGVKRFVDADGTVTDDTILVCLDRAKEEANKSHYAEVVNLLDKAIKKSFSAPSETPQGDAVNPDTGVGRPKMGSLANDGREYKL